MSQLRHLTAGIHWANVRPLTQVFLDAPSNKHIQVRMCRSSVDFINIVPDVSGTIMEILDLARPKFGRTRTTYFWVR